jgi:hypothetical protein
MESALNVCSTLSMVTALWGAFDCRRQLVERDARIVALTGERDTFWTLDGVFIQNAPIPCFEHWNR